MSGQCVDCPSFDGVGREDTLVVCFLNAGLARLPPVRPAGDQHGAAFPSVGPLGRASGVSANVGAPKSGGCACRQRLPTSQLCRCSASLQHGVIEIRPKVPPRAWWCGTQFLTRPCTIACESGRGRAFAEGALFDWGLRGGLGQLYCMGNLSLPVKCLAELKHTHKEFRAMSAQWGHGVGQASRVCVWTLLGAVRLGRRLCSRMPGRRLRGDIAGTPAHQAVVAFKRLAPKSCRS